MINTPKWFEENKLQIIVGAVGLGMMAFGIWKGLDEKMQADSNVVIKANKESTSAAGNIGNEIMVDVGGAVEKPGVYALKSNIRVNDALMAAGGLSADADRSYVSRNINLAEKMQDGQKIYIPSKNSDPQPEMAMESGNHTKISINTASKTELEKLWGVGEARAQIIIDNRPYSQVQDLITKLNLPQNLIDKNSGIISL